MSHFAFLQTEWHTLQEEVQPRHPKDILADLTKLDAEIQRGMKELEGMLK